MPQAPSYRSKRTAGRSGSDILRRTGLRVLMVSGLVTGITCPSIFGALAAPTTPSQGAVAAGADHTVALMRDGTVQAWGSNTHGQLGDGTTTDRATPVGVQGLQSVAAADAGTFHTVALRSDGTVWTWGLNGNGQLGDATIAERPTPGMVAGLTAIVAVAVGSDHTLALKSDGTVWAWGNNYDGQLGDGTTTSRPTPIPVQGLARVIALAAGASHSVALRDDGTVWTWGKNDYSALGDGTTTRRNTPVQVSALSGVVAIAAGDWHTAAVAGDGTVWAWGFNYSGQLGDGTTVTRSLPKPMIGIRNATAVSAGTDQTLVLTADGLISACGKNEEGQLGDGTLVQRTTPVQLAAPTDVVALACGSDHAVALRRDGTIAAWGDNVFGQLGDGSTTRRSRIPVQVSERADFNAIRGGDQFTLALKRDGTVWAWGTNNPGQLGYPQMTVRSNTPVPLGSASGVAAIAAGAQHAIWLQRDGTVWTWGSNSTGQLGGSTHDNLVVPGQVIGISGAVAVAAGGCHSVAVAGDGTVLAWGDNSYGQLGDGTTYNRLSLVLVRGLDGVVAVEAGYFHSVALKDDGTVWTWGFNGSGQLGNGTMGRRTTPPAQVLGLGDVKAVAAGNYHSVALKRDGTVWTWGLNESGQLGDGTTTSRSTAARVPGLDEIVAVAAGYQHTLALGKDGTVWAWGKNSGGELGDGTTTNRTTPVRVPEPAGITAITAGFEQTVVLRNDGTLRGWGGNRGGELAFPYDHRTQAAIRLFPAEDDTDSDGMSDAWEIASFGDLSHTGGTDSDADGATDSREFAQHSDPLQANTDGDYRTDFVDHSPDDYFNGTTPLLTIVGGNNQYGTVGSFNVQPFDVAVWDSAGTTPLVNAPVDFSVIVGDGLLAPTSDAQVPATATVSVRTDVDGTAQAYYRQPGTAGVAGVTLVRTGPAFLTMASTSMGEATADDDGDGVANGAEVTQGTDPEDYYNGTGPALAFVVGSDGQTGAGGMVSVRVTRAADNAPLANAPVRLSLTGAYAGISAVAGGPLAGSLIARTDADGIVRGYVTFRDLKKVVCSAIARRANSSIGIGYSVVLGPPPFLANGLRLWLKADNLALANGAAVASWPDQSARGGNATQQIQAYRPTLATSAALNDRPAVRFTSGYQYLNLPDIMGNPAAAAGEIFIVAKAANETGPMSLANFGTGIGTSSNAYIFGTYTTENFGSTVSYTCSKPPQSRTDWHLYDVSAKADEWTARQNGRTYLLKRANTVGFRTNPLLGSGSTTGSSGFKGDIAEVIVFDRVLTEAERTTVATYLAKKYALTVAPAAPSEVSATALNNTQVQLAWTTPAASDAWRQDCVIERQTAGSSAFQVIATVRDSQSYIDTVATAGTTCIYRVRALNFAGSSPYSPAVSVTTRTDRPVALPLSALNLWLRADAGTGPGAVPCWEDQSGRANHANQSGINARPVVAEGAANGHPAMRFTNGYQYFPLPDLMKTASAGEMYVVLKAAYDGATRMSVANFGGPAGVSYTNYITETNLCTENFGSNKDYVFNKPPLPRNNWHLYNVSAREGEWVARQNGTPYCTQTTNTVAFRSNPVLGAATTSGYQGFRGDIAEVLVFNRTLTEAERAMVNDYLDHKYALGLPTAN